MDADAIKIWELNTNTDISQHITSKYYWVLSTDEKSRAKQLKQARFSHQFISTRILCRFLLSYYRGNIAPNEWQFRKSEYGKPEVANRLIRPIYFNISHSAHKIVMAVSGSSSFGVDIESINHKKSHLKIVEHFFTEAEQKWIHESKTTEFIIRFYQLWTLKESYLKAVGTGLKTPLNSFTIDMSSDKPTLIQPKDKSWNLDNKILNDEYSLSIAYTKEPSRTADMRLHTATDIFF